MDSVLAFVLGLVELALQTRRESRWKGLLLARGNPGRRVPVRT
jgi:hypothetical protein